MNIATAIGGVILVLFGNMYLLICTPISGLQLDFVLPLSNVIENFSVTRVTNGRIINSDTLPHTFI